MGYNTATNFFILWHFVRWEVKAGYFEFKFKRLFTIFSEVEGKESCSVFMFADLEWHSRDEGYQPWFFCIMALVPTDLLSSVHIKEIFKSHTTHRVDLH